MVIFVYYMSLCVFKSCDLFFNLSKQKSICDCLYGTGIIIDDRDVLFLQKPYPFLFEIE